jgi:hypothetical protein
LALAQSGDLEQDLGKAKAVSFSSGETSSERRRASVAPLRLDQHHRNKGGAASGRDKGVKENAGVGAARTGKAQDTARVKVRIVGPKVEVLAGDVMVGVGPEDQGARDVQYFFDGATNGAVGRKEGPPGRGEPGWSAFGKNFACAE